uniref:Cytochrome P450 CYP18A1 n=1 Tax=Daphnia magna TaxID=35525 RepID=A0A0A8J7J5_9CRUS|nr:cytochrome P450 CYP18A1 [Daphnia magna]
MIVWSLGRLATWMLHLIIDTSCSESLWTTLLFVVVAWLASYLWRWWRTSRNLPPGPYGYPIVGYLMRIKREFHEELTALSRKFGSVFSVRLGSELIVVLSDHKIIREAFRREEFACRPDNDFMKLLDGYGIINTEGKMWKEQRRFLHERLRHFGMKHMGDGREKMENRIMIEVYQMITELADKKSAPVELGSYLSSAVSNVICSLLMSVRFRHDDPKFIRFTNLIDDGFKLFTVTAAAGFIPILKLLPAFNYAFNKIRQNFGEISNFYQEIVDDHKRSFDANNIRDIIDGYILEIQNAKEEGRSEQLFNGKNGDRQMQQIIGDMFSAGTETVKTTLQWATVFALREPHMQARVQEELDRVVTRFRMPMLDDLPNLPYTEAFMLEVMRRATAVPLGTTHSTSRTTTLNGFTIPKGTKVIPLIHAVHMNPALWKDPEGFNPERFLSADGTKVVKPDYFIPFGVGRRVCLGDVLAKAELFLFFSSLLHTFTLTVPQGASVPDLRGQAGVTVSPQTFQVCAKARYVENVVEGETQSSREPFNVFPCLPYLSCPVQ